MIELAAEISTIIMLVLLLAANKRFCQAIGAVTTRIRQVFVRIYERVGKFFGGHTPDA